jgi:flagellar assembly factor FliW
MNISTKNFGDLEIDDEKILTFDEGLPGFRDDRRFAILNEDSEEPFCWLQSMDNGDVAFALLNTFKLLPAYNPLVDESELAALGDISDKDLLIYNIVVIPEDIKQMRVNLKAPVVINPATQKGRQVVAANEDYAIRHYIFEENR